jgi:hypothetical protein
LKSRFVWQKVHQSGDHFLRAKWLAKSPVNAKQSGGLQRVEFPPRAPGYGNDLDGRGNPAQLADRLEAVLARHIDVHHHDVGWIVAEKFNAFGAITRFRNDIPRIAQCLAQRYANNRVIINNQYTGGLPVDWACGTLPLRFLCRPLRLAYSRGRR